MECRDAQFYLRLKRHAADELGADVSNSLDGHLATCPACSADARAALSFDRAVASAMRAVPVPGGLRDKLVAHVAAKQGAVLRRKLYRAATATAAAVVLLFLGLSVFSVTRPPFDAEIVRSASDQMNKPDDTTREWLAAQKLPDRLPLAFDYDLLVYRGLASVKGNEVPVVAFRSPNGSGFAWVYIIREDGRFNLKDIEESQHSHARGFPIVGQDRFRGVTYYVVHTGGPKELDQFLITRRGGANPA
jgi:hypothetical protein